MQHTFQLVGIDHRQFDHLFDLTDDQLKEYNAEHCIVHKSPGYPCRISLEDAREGEELLLLPYMHQPATSPYRGSGPIFVRRGVKKRKLAPGEVTAYLISKMVQPREWHEAGARWSGKPSVRGAAGCFADRIGD